ncbi:hypothetical protein GobsT_25760 [Gemmata obscuriglobus]|uniref:Uncharacterized protein n=1 Tax=Gemmata obscuriglobus TaxID=114 RepID=A0A2Z3HBV9_9BACT|nr:hypothetical protein [Gemmata obscuriglobus]AWM39144.1 hypothetical protein C1280_20585 [Gemmata obscuriglobus]QEG27812.1 hypothetical protein GobsT_25760 [Gemmata obscuriglobus]VTS05150.1 unnamed protein product [Gemmata obscuriglobus UQM 2246]
MNVLSRLVLAVVAALWLPLAALADGTQPMAVQAGSWTVGENGVNVDAACLKKKLKEPTAGTSLSLHEGKVVVEVHDGTKWVEHSTLADAVTNGHLVIEGITQGRHPDTGETIGRFDAIKIRPGTKPLDGNVRVTFREPTVFGAEGTKVADFKEAAGLVGDIQQYAKTFGLQPNEARFIAQHAYWALDRQGKATKDEVAKLTKMSEEEFTKWLIKNMKP